jgi:hypothetical protein
MNTMCMYIIPTIVPVTMITSIWNNCVSRVIATICLMSENIISNFIYIISYDATIYYSILFYGLVLTIASYMSMLFVPMLLFFIFFPLSNSYLISNTVHQPEYLYVSLLMFIFLEILLSIYLSIILLSLFIILTSLEFSNTLDIIYINDNPMTVVQLTIVFLHLMHLVVGILLILLELVYPHYYHFIEVIWLLIGYSIYLN